jgi:hypothetical protein
MRAVIGLDEQAEARSDVWGVRRRYSRRRGKDTANTQP